MSAAVISPEATTEKNGSLRSRAIRGSIWTMGGYIAANMLRLGSNLALTRMLFPSVYGKMAIVSIFVQGLQMFSDVGIGPSIVQNPRGEDRNFLNTAWTMQVIRGFFIMLCTFIVAWLVAKIYGQPDLLYVLPIVGITALVGGFNSTALFTLSRRIQLAKLTLLELGTQVASILVMVVWAYFNRTVWALVAGTVASSVLRMVISHFLVDGPKDRLMWDRECATALLKFGRWIFISTMLTFFAGEADRMIFGVKIPIELMGIYSLATMLAGLPTQAIIKIAGTVTFSVYSRAGSDRSAEAFSSIFWQIRYPILIFGAVAVSGLIVTGPALIAVMYDERYRAGGWMLQLCTVCAWFEILETSNGSAVLALGKPGWLAIANACKLVGLFVFIPIGQIIGTRYGSPFVGMLVGLMLSEVVRYASTGIALLRHGYGSFMQDTGISLLTAGIVAAALFVEHLLKAYISSVWVPALISGSLVALAWLPLVWRAYRNVVAPRRKPQPVDSTELLVPDGAVAS
jgi:O-antigen/teichoic acid export membrane protein